MFETLSKGFREARNRLAGLTELNEANIQKALREVRLSLLEADVELGVVKRFLARVEQKALGQTHQSRIKHDGSTQTVTAGDIFIKICHDELVSMMRGGAAPDQAPPEGIEALDIGAKRAGIMMVGLQGSGKTTTTAKLARLLQKNGKKPLLVAADMQRPAAVEQLQILGEKIDVPVFNISGASPVDIAKAAPDEAKKRGCDVIIYDTAGRLAIDEPLMEELGAIKAAIKPENILLVIDAMIGQDAVQTARGFNERLDISGVVLTKLDGDARGGAAISVREVTGAPILFAGMGETIDKLDPFRPDGMASRILGMGDVVGLMQDFEEVIDKKKAEEDAARMMSGQFTLEDFLNQIRTIKKMGSLKDLVDKVPGMGGMIPPGANLDDTELVKIEAVIQSMTPQEKVDPNALIREPSRVKRIAKGSGNTEETVGELIQKFLFMQNMLQNMGGMGGMGGPLGGLMNQIPGMKNLNMARNMRRAMKGGGMPPGMPPGMGMPGMPGMPGMSMPGMPGMAGPEAPKMRQLSRTEKNAKKNARKAQRSARKKGKKK